MKMAMSFDLAQIYFEERNGLTAMVLALAYAQEGFLLEEVGDSQFVIYAPKSEEMRIRRELRLDT